MALLPRPLKLLSPIRAGDRGFTLMTYISIQAFQSIIFVESLDPTMSDLKEKLEAFTTYRISRTRLG
jgi:hypothetical protein